MTLKELTIKEKKEKSLKHSIKDGCGWATMVGFGENYISPFAIALNATNQQIALLASIPQLLSSLFQLIAAKITDLVKNRKKIILYGVLIQALIWLPLFYIPFITKNIYFLIAFVSVYFIAGSFGAPAWNSWMGELVEEDKRGKYFGFRNKIMGFFTVVSISLAGFILSKFKQVNVFYGFGIIFMIGLIARAFSTFYIKKMYEPQYIVEKKDYFSFVDFVKKMRKTNYGIFVLFMFFLRFSVFVAGPFFAVYMLRDLNFSYMTYTIVTVTATIITFITMTYWGKYADRFGNRNILTITSYLVPLAPILWLFSTNIVYLIFIQIFTGFIWAGFELSAANFIFDTVKPKNRAKCVSYYNVFNGLGMFFGSMVGGALALKLVKPSFLMSSLQLLFLISGILRLFVVLYFIPKIKEVRVIQHMPEGELLVRAVAIDPIRGIAYEGITGMKTIGDIGKKGIVAGVKAVEIIVKDTEQMIGEITEKAKEISIKEGRRRAMEKKKLVREFEEFVHDLVPKKKGKKEKPKKTKRETKKL